MLDRWRSMTTGLAFLAGACASVPQRNEVYRLPADYNFAFYDTYNEAARSFYAAHYAHFGTYETLLDHGENATAEMAAFREGILGYMMEPPVFEPPAEIIAPEWSKIAYETGRAMDWSHMLHTQLYDIVTDDRVVDKKAAGERAIAYYLSNRQSAFSTRGYGHRWMLGGGTWAEVFAKKYPQVNGILWAYHWHHAAVYEALMESDPARRRAELDRVISVFQDSVLKDPPKYMPLMGEVAPKFTRMLPAAAQIFDNLHMMHDVVNDIMADERLSLREKEAEIERMRRNMSYAAQEVVVAPGMSMHGGHAMAESAMRVPTRLSDGTWLPQGHPEARLASMEELALPMGAAPAASEPPPMEHGQEPPVEAGHRHDGGGR